MAQYFMSDTRLAGLEQMMMAPSRTAPTRNTDTRRKRPQKKLPSNRPVKPRQREWEMKEGFEEGGGV